MSRYEITVYEGSRPLSFGGNRTDYLREAGRIAWMLCGRSDRMGATPLTVEIYDSQKGRLLATWSPSPREIWEPIRSGIEFLPDSLVQTILKSEEEEKS